jgi:8-oxo-dGTP diphosphatase
MREIEVVAAVIHDNGRVFSAQRGAGGEAAFMWEFPGGKIEAGESHETALKREIEEEFSSQILVKQFILTTKHKYVSFHLTMHVYLAILIRGDLRPNEHVSTRWLDRSDIDSVEWAPADLPIVQAVIDMGIVCNLPHSGL